MLRKITISYTKKDGKTEGAYTAYTDVNANSHGRLVFLSMVMQDSSARSFIHDFKEGISARTSTALMPASKAATRQWNPRK